MARAFISAGSSDVYEYLFNHSLSFDGWGPDYAFCDGHVCHGAELPFIFQSPSRMNMSFTSDEQVMADSMTLAWGNFAHSGNPNQPTPLDLAWASYTPSGDNLNMV